MKIIVSCGDINGIGLEVFFKALDSYGSEFKKNGITFTLVCNSKIVEEYKRICNYSFGNIHFDLINIADKFAIEFGNNSSKAGNLAKSSFEYAANELILGKFNALLTLPISKKSVYMAGWKMPGHTEYLAELCSSSSPLMILFSEKMRVALATVHIPIRKITETLNYELVSQRIIDLDSSLKKDFGITHPKIAVLGLNPHSGEQGEIGNEEIQIIEPAIQNAMKENILVFGTFPADGFFAHGLYAEYDGILAMYHDQGLIPLKMSAKGGGVNFTANLPVIRTSPDHGTGFDIAGKGIANPQSTIDSIISANNIFISRQKYFANELAKKKFLLI